MPAPSPLFRPAGGGSFQTITNQVSLATASGDGTDPPVTITSATAGDIILVGAGVNDSSAAANTVITISDNIGDNGGLNPWTKISEEVSDTAHIVGAWGRVAIFMKVAVGGETSVQNTSSADSYTGIACAQFRKAGGSWSVDGTATGGEGAANPNGPDNITIASTSSLVFVFGLNQRVLSSTAAPFDTNNIEIVPGGGARFTVSWNIYSSAAGTKTLNNIWTWNNTSDYVACAAAIKAS